MEERELRALVDRVKAGTLSRRRFVRMMVGLGLTAPMAAQMLASAGVVEAQAKWTFNPTKRGGGGLVKTLWWQAPTLLNPHFANGTKDQDACRIFYEPLASYDPDGNVIPVLAAETPSLQNGGVAKDGMSVTWKLKKNVVWHDGKPFTADDVVFNWEYVMDPATAAVTIGPYRDVVRIDKLDSHTVKIVFKSPAPFWAAPFCGTATGVIIPKHLFQAYKGDKSREAPNNLKPVGTGQDQASDPERPGCPPGAEPPGRPRLDSGRDLRAHRHRDRQLPQRAVALRVEEHEVGVQRREGQSDPRGGRLQARQRRRAREGWQEAEVSLPDLHQPFAAENPADREASVCQGGHRPRAEIRHGKRLLRVGSGQPGHVLALLRRPADVHDDHDAARSAALHGSVHFLGGLGQGQQVRADEQDALAQRGIRPVVESRRERDGPGQACGALRQDERSGDPECRGDPRRVAPRGVRRVQPDARRGPERVGQQLLGARLLVEDIAGPGGAGRVARPRPTAWTACPSIFCGAR